MSFRISNYMILYICTDFSFPATYTHAHKHTHMNAGDGDVVVKAQVLAGGRGKGRFSNGFQGGVHMADRYSANVHTRFFCALIFALFVNIVLFLRPFVRSFVRLLFAIYNESFTLNINGLVCLLLLRLFFDGWSVTKFEIGKLRVI